MKFKTFMTNMICATIPCKKTRDIIRIKIKHCAYVNYCKKFALAHTFGTHHKVKLTVGSRSRNLIILIDKLYAFKFPLDDNGYDKSIREQRITDAFSKISPIHIPKPRIYQWGDITVRRYDFSHGVLLKQIPTKQIIINKPKIALQIAQFIYTIGTCDPIDISDLKPDTNIKPSFLRGWFHNDIAENFTINPTTFEITSFIDWEDAAFVDFHYGLTQARKSWDKHGLFGMMDDVMNAYATMYSASGKVY